MGDRDNGFTRRDLLTLFRRPLSERPPEAAPPTRAPSVPPNARPASIPPPEPPSIPPAARGNSYVPPPLTPSTRPPRPPGELLRPPGALPEREFLDACTRCGECVEACPVDAIKLLAHGPSAGTPAIDTRVSPCHLCEGLRCAAACPSGALVALGARFEVRMGTAVIDARECLAYRGAPCRACVDVCPLPGVLRFERGQAVLVPVAGPESCVGCGMCHRYCPSPDAIRIVPSVAPHAATRARVQHGEPE